jgi:iron(III) transport system substrate-binding protein
MRPHRSFGKRRAALGALLVLVLAVFACAPATPAAKPAAAPPSAEAGVDARGVVVRKPGEALPDYLARLHEAAKREGEVVMYHSSDPREMSQYAEGFEKLFPGIKFTQIQASESAILERALTEGRAGRTQADVYLGSTDDQAEMADAGLLVEYRPANEEFVDPAYVLKGEPYIVRGYLSFHVAYNTNLIKPEELPNTWEGFTEPKWRGKLAIDQDAFEWFAGVVHYMGEQRGLEFMRKLALQQPRLVQGATLRTELLAAGEFPVALDLYGHRIKTFMSRGQPIAAKVPNPEPIVALTATVGVTKDARHPNAARLVLEYYLMDEAQQLYANQNRATVRLSGVAHPYPELIKDGKFSLLAPRTLDYDKAARQFREIFIRG